MSKTIVFDKPSMPYGAGEVATFEDDQAERFLKHPRQVAHLAKPAEIEAANNRYRRRSPAAEPAASTSDSPAAVKDEDLPKSNRGNR